MILAQNSHILAKLAIWDPPWTKPILTFIQNLFYFRFLDQKNNQMKGYPQKSVFCSPPTHMVVKSGVNWPTVSTRKFLSFKIEPFASFLFRTFMQVETHFMQTSKFLSFAIILFYKIALLFTIRSIMFRHIVFSHILTMLATLIVMTPGPLVMVVSRSQKAALYVMVFLPLLTCASLIGMPCQKFLKWIS